MEEVAQREVKGNSLKELRVYKFNLKGVMEMSEKAHVKCLRDTKLYYQLELVLNS